jgi:hypothetical protein
MTKRKRSARIAQDQVDFYPPRTQQQWQKGKPGDYETHLDKEAHQENMAFIQIAALHLSKDDDNTGETHKSDGDRCDRQ